MSFSFQIFSTRLDNKFKYLDVNSHPNTCSAIRPFYSVSAWQLDNAKSRTNVPLISSPGNWTQCFLWWSPIQVLTLLSDNSTHWAAVMLQECSEQNSICPCLSLPAGLLDRETVLHPSTLQTAFIMCLRLSDSHQDSEYYRKEQSTQSTLQRPRAQLSLSNLSIGGLHG